MIKLNKHGDDQTISLIRTLIILIVSFLIILGFIFLLNPAKTSDESVCHNAVVSRGAGVLPKEIIPLNCKTNYVCISKDGSCETMTSPEVIKASTANDVYNALANQMAECWWMFGEGNLDYIGNKYTYDLYCSICSQFAFDDSIKKIFPNGQIDQANFYSYLANTNAPGKTTSYLYYFIGAQNAQVIQNTLNANNVGWGTINVSNRYLVTMGEFSRVGTLQNILMGMWKGVKLFLVLPIPLIGGPWAVSIIASTIIPTNKNYLVGTILTGNSGHNYLTPTIIEANSEDYNKLQCADIKTLA